MSHISKIVTTIRAYIFEKNLSQYTAALPTQFLLQDKDIQKNSVPFAIYKKILLQRVQTVEELQAENSVIIDKIHIRQAKKILALASKTKWWNDYFQKNGIVFHKVNTFSEFQQIPPVTRNNFTEVSKADLLLVPETDQLLLWRGSSGSTSGVPLVWGLNKTILVVNVLTDLLLELKKRGFSITKNMDHDFHLHFNMFMTSQKHAFKWFSQTDFQTNTQDKDHPEKIHILQTIIQHTKNLVLLTGPNEILPLIDSFRNFNLHVSIPYLITVGSPLSTQAREAAKEYFTAQVFSFYGAQEMGPCAIECCDNPDTYHILSDRVIVELLTEEGVPAPQGSGGIITVTCLDNTVMPLIRYQPGDWGEFVHHATCTCNNNFPLLKILQRTTDKVYFSDNTSESITPLLRFFNRPPYVSIVRRFQIQQEVLDQIIIRLETRSLLPDTAIVRLEKNIQLFFKGKLKATIEQMPVIQETSAKFRVFIPLKKRD